MGDSVAKNSETPNLYQIDPIGVGTSCMESLPSYIKRLAKAHSVSPLTLLSEELLPKRTYFKAIYNPASFLSNEIVSALVKKTGVPKIRKLFLRRGELLLEAKNIFRGHFLVDTRHIFRDYLAWCPFCFEESKTSHHDIYEKMQWCFSDVTTCSEHEIALLTQCPYCKNEVSILSASSVVGYCDSCLSWIGLSDQMMQHLKPVDRFWDIRVRGIEQMIRNNGYRTKDYVLREYSSFHILY